MSAIDSVVSSGRKELGLFDDAVIDVVELDPVGAVRVKVEPKDEEDSGETSVSAQAATSTPTKPRAKRACLLLPEDDPAAFSFVASAASQVGVALGQQEELAPNIYYPAAQKLVLRAAKCLAEAIVRKSHRAAYRRLGGRHPAAVGAADVLAAVETDPDLDILSTKGLAAEAAVKEHPVIIKQEPIE